MLSDTFVRAVQNTSPEVQERIRDQTVHSIRQAVLGGEPAIERRLHELSAEWDIERTLEANASTLVVIGVLLGAFVNRKWLILPGVVGAFLLQHALQGWCPPLPLFRQNGVRTAREILGERNALKALRGDFEEIGKATDPEAAAEAYEASLR